MYGPGSAYDDIERTDSVGEGGLRWNHGEAAWPKENYLAVEPGSRAPELIYRGYRDTERNAYRRGGRNDDPKADGARTTIDAEVPCYAALDSVRGV